MVNVIPLVPDTYRVALVVACIAIQHCVNSRIQRLIKLGLGCTHPTPLPSTSMEFRAATGTNTGLSRLSATRTGRLVAWELNSVINLPVSQNPKNEKELESGTSFRVVAGSDDSKRSQNSVTEHTDSNA